MNRILFLGLWVALTTLAWAQTPPAPAATDFQSDLCAVCKMAVTSKSYAAQIVTEGKPLFFDDVGCLIQYERRGQILPEAVRARYVRSVAGDAWLAVETALWVTTKEVRTPMGYGFHAFADKPAAEAFLASHPQARLVGWAEAKGLVPESMGMGPGTMGKK